MDNELNQQQHSHSKVPCKECAGTGSYRGFVKQCPFCDGWGFIWRPSAFSKISDVLNKIKK